MTAAIFDTSRSSLPRDAKPYRTIGPFDATTLPSGLRRTHDLASGVWGVLELLEGRITFVWEDGNEEWIELASSDQLVIPPKVPHHVESEGSFLVRITFFRA